MRGESRPQAAPAQPGPGGPPRRPPPRRSRGAGAGARPQLRRVKRGPGGPAGRAGPRGAPPPAAAQRGPAAGFLRLVRAVNGAPARRLSLPPRGCLPGAGPSPREVQGNLQTRRFSCKSSAVIQFSGIFPAGRPKTPAKTQDNFFRLAFFAPKDLIFRPHFAMIKGNTLSKRGTGHDTGPASADQR